MKVTMIGTLPPVRGMSHYFINFKHLYPPFLYPQSTTEEDPNFKVECNENLVVHERLRWYNLICNIRAGLSINTPVIHLQWWTYVLFFVIYPLVLVNKLFKRQIVIGTLHNVVGHESGKLDRFLCRLMYRMLDHYIVHSQMNKCSLQKFMKINGDKISVIPHGRYNFYQDQQITKEEAQAKLNLPRDKKWILHFGLIRDYKGVDVLIRAMDRIRNTLPEVHCMIVGNPWVSWQPYQKLIDQSQLNEKFYLDLRYIATSQVKYFFAAADLVVLPYKSFEAQSGVGNVALGFGKPLLVTNVGGLPDLVIDKRAVIPPDDVSALTSALTELFTNKVWYKKLQSDSETMAKAYDWDQIADQTIQLYQKLADKNA